jgi:tripartite-type tricarboxylate transporter receptor subunit TctC
VQGIAPIALVGKTSLLVAVPADLPVKNLKDLAERVRAQPSAVTYGSSGIGSMSHLGMEMFAADASCVWCTCCTRALRRLSPT